MNLAFDVGSLRWVARVQYFRLSVQHQYPKVHKNYLKQVQTYDGGDDVNQRLYNLHSLCMH